MSMYGKEHLVSHRSEAIFQIGKCLQMDTMWLCEEEYTSNITTTWIVQTQEKIALAEPCLSLLKNETMIQMFCFN